MELITERIELNSRIKKALSNIGYKQNQFADLVGISYPQMSVIFKGRRAITPYICLVLEYVGLESAEYWMGEESKCKLIEAKDKIDLKRIICNYFLNDKPKKGTVIKNTEDGKKYIYNGFEWVEI